MDRYYYAGGERHPLELAADRVVVDANAAQAAGLGEAVAGLPASSKLPGGLTVVKRSELPPALRVRLEHAHALRAVYKSGDAFIVLMPEVRLEFDAGSRQQALQAVDSSSIPAEITSDTSDRVSLRPQSGNVEDALDLANHIAENAHAASASVRMLNIVPKWDIKPRER